MPIVKVVFLFFISTRKERWPATQSSVVGLNKVFMMHDYFKQPAGSMF
jgi:hypothetical protein